MSPVAACFDHKRWVGSTHVIVCPHPWRLVSAWFFKQATRPEWGSGIRNCSKAHASLAITTRRKKTQMRIEIHSQTLLAFVVERIAW